MGFDFSKFVEAEKASKAEKVVVALHKNATKVQEFLEVLNDSKVQVTYGGLEEILVDSEVPGVEKGQPYCGGAIKVLNAMTVKAQLAVVGEKGYGKNAPEEGRYSGSVIPRNNALLAFLKWKLAR